jgi:hypothetical protein
MSNAQQTQKILSLVATFENGDQLDLTLEKQAQYGTYLPADIWVLTYSERYEGSYDGSTSEGHYFMTTQSEYFPAEEPALAKAAFNIRLLSNTPAKSSGRGLRMRDFLTERPKTVSV